MLPSDGILTPGMFARVEIVLGERTAPALPRDAIVRISGTGNYVCYVLDGDHASLRNIKTGMEQGKWVEITSGLERDDNVIATLSRRIGDGVKVRVSER
jgi:multidrug efflux pump subunit AcrA (membrane-fusion protein)